jgi:HK97 gp10 family phage protein
MGKRGVSVKVEGLRELEASLKQLPKATARNVLKRVLVKAGQPIAEQAARLAPDDPRTGAPDLHTSIAVSAKVRNDVGKAAFAKVLREGGSRDDAVSALRGARREAKGAGSFATMFIGPTVDSFYGKFQEFGTVKQAAQPFMRPAWDANKEGALATIRGELGAEIDKAAKRVAKRAARKAAKAA